MPKFANYLALQKILKLIVIDTDNKETCAIIQNDPDMLQLALFSLMFLAPTKIIHKIVLQNYLFHFIKFIFLPQISLRLQ